MPEQQRQIFISYAREDLEIAERLYNDLKRAGLNPWLDKVSLLPGEFWKVRIRETIKASSHVIALLSTMSVSKRGYVQKELKDALSVLEEVPESQVFLIPIRLNECKPSHAQLQELHWVDLFPSYEDGLRNLLRVLKADSSVGGIPQSISASVTDESKASRREQVNKLFSEKPFAQRGSYFVLPSLIDKGSVRRFGMGLIHKITAIDKGILAIANGGACLFDLSNGEPLWQIDCPTRSGTATGQGSLLALAFGSKIHLWYSATGKYARVLEGHKDDVVSVAMSEDGQLVASGCDDQVVRLWDLPSGRLILELRSPFRMRCIAVSPDKQLLAIAGEKEIGLLEIPGQKRVQLDGYSYGSRELVFSPNGRWLASATDSYVRLWQLPAGRQVWDESYPRNVGCLTFSPNNQMLACGISHGNLTLIGIKTGQELQQLDVSNRQVRGLAFSADSDHLLIGSDDEILRRIDITSGEEIQKITGTGTDPRGLNSIAFHPNGRLLAAGSDDGVVRLWDSKSGRELWRQGGPWNRVRGVTFNPDGSILAIGIDYEAVLLLDVESGHEMRRMKQTRAASCVAISPNGRLLASGSDGGLVWIWDVNSGQEVSRLEGHEVSITSVAFSPDGQLLASGGGDKTIRLWDTGSFASVSRLEGATGWVDGLAFSPSGAVIVSGGQDNVIRMWDVDSGREMRQFKGHLDWVTSVAFHRGGNLLASGSNDNSVRLWDVSSGQQVGKLEGHINWVESVAFGTTSEVLASGSRDGTIRIWHISL